MRRLPADTGSCINTPASPSPPSNRAPAVLNPYRSVHSPRNMIASLGSASRPARPLSWLYCSICDQTPMRRTTRIVVASILTPNAFVAVDTRSVCTRCTASHQSIRDALPDTYA